MPALQPADRRDPRDRATTLRSEAEKGIRPCRRAVWVIQSEDIAQHLSSDDVVRMAKRLGVRVSKSSRTGEYISIFRDGQQHLMNAKRKD